VGFLIDTCVWIDIERGNLAPADVASFTKDEPVFLSPVTLAELKFGAEVTADAQIRQRRLAALARLRRKPLLPIDGNTGEIFGQLAAQLKAGGRSPRQRVQDLLARQPGDSTLLSVTYQERGGFRRHSRVGLG
jgi:predicted nucleic acid-binding protein